MENVIITAPKRPNWTDRQMIAAADLRAEQDWQDAQLTRLRRLALGWGVVAGLEVFRDGAGVRIEPGYGISGAGSEVYVAEPFHWDDIHKRMMVACGLEEGCDLAGPAGVTAELPLTAWLVLRPTRLASCPRPAVPEGCAHPGSDYAYSRLSGAVSLEVHCTLPDRLRRAEPDCEGAKAYLAGAPVPMPTPEDDLLPIAQLVCVGDTLQAVNMEARPRLLPLHVIESLIACCKCDEDEEEPEVPDGPTPPDPGPDFGWDKPFDSPLGDLIDKIRDALPGGSADLDLTFAEMFAEESSLALLRSARSKGSEIAKAFAASLLVPDAASLEAYLNLPPSEFYKWTLENSVKTTLRVTLSSAETKAIRTAIATTKIGEAFETSEGYGWVKENLGDVPGSELISRDPEKLRDEFNIETDAAEAAMRFLHARLLLLK